MSDHTNMTPLETIVFNYRRTHERALKITEDLSDEQLNWRALATVPSIGFHVWHMARYADSFQQLVAGSGDQIWEKERLAEQWGLITIALGEEETGTGMGDEMSADLRLPAKNVLLAYVRKTFDAATQAVGLIDEEIFQKLTKAAGHEGLQTMGLVLTSAVTHDNRHLGMIEALRGVQGLRGTATT